MLEVHLQLAIHLLLAIRLQQAIRLEWVPSRRVITQPAGFQILLLLILRM